MSKRRLKELPTAFPIDHDIASRRFKILGDKNRLAILKLLMRNPRSVGDIVTTLGIGRTLVSHNLKILRAEGLVATTRYGKCIVYAISNDLNAEGNGSLDLKCCSVCFN